MAASPVPLNASAAMPQEWRGGSPTSPPPRTLSPVRTAAYTSPDFGCTAMADAGAPMSYASHLLALPPLPVSPTVFFTTVYSNVVSDVFTTKIGPDPTSGLAFETYAMSRASSRTRSDRSYLVVSSTSVALPTSISPCFSSIVLVTAYAAMSIVVMLALPSPFHSLPSHPRPASPTPHRWTTCISPVLPLISKSTMRELVPLNLMSFIRPCPFSTLSYMRRCE